MSTAEASAWAGRSTGRLLDGQALHGVLINASRDPDAKLTFVVTGGGPPDALHLAMKIPVTSSAGTAVDHEGRMLVDIRRLGLGALASTVPRYVETMNVDGLPVLLSTAVTGTPMSVRYHHVGHTARPAAVRRDFAAAMTWLAAFQTETGRAGAPADWPATVAAGVLGRWDGHPSLAAATARLDAALDRLAGARPPTTAVHGDFWFGNLLMQGDDVSGVVDWEAAAVEGSPLQDLARFVLSYSLYLDRHTRPGHRVLGHPALRRGGVLPGVDYALTGPGWFPELVRQTLGTGLARLGVPPALWYDVALVGVAEVAMTANDDDFGASHLELLAALPVHARRRRRQPR